MTTQTASAETGTNGNSVSTGDTGTPAWDAVNIGTSCTLTYSNTGGCKRQTLCYAYSAAGTSASSYAEWTVNGGASAAVQFHRLYIDPADFSGAPLLARGMDSGATNQRWRLIFSASTVVLRNAANTVVFTSSSLSSGTRYRVEWSVGGSTTGACQLQIFVGESLSTFYDSGAGTDNFGGVIQKVRFGIGTGQTSVSGKFDDVAWSDTAAIGAATVSPAPAEGAWSVAAGDPTPAVSPAPAEAAWTLAAQDPTVSTAAGGASPTPAEAAWSISAGAPTPSVAPSPAEAAWSIAAGAPTTAVAPAAGVAAWSVAAGAPTVAVTLAGVPFLDPFVAGYNFCFEIYPGVDVTAIVDTWIDTGVDITTDLFQPDDGGTPAIVISRALGDEQTFATSAQLQCTLKNPLGDYTPGRAMSPYYPYMQVGLPVRCRILSATNQWEQFTGQVDDIEPLWDTTGNAPFVVLTAHGALTRLTTGNQALHSALYRSTAAVTGLVNYWPMEEPDTAGVYASPFGTPPNLFVTAGTQGADATLTGSAGLPTFDATSTLRVVFDPIGSTGHWQIDWWMKPVVPAANTILLNLFTTGDGTRWQIVAGAAGASLGIAVYDSSGTALASDTTTPGDFFDGNWHHMRIYATHSGTTTSYTLDWANAALGGGFSISDTFHDKLGQPVAVTIPAQAGLDGMSIGHFSLFNLANVNTVHTAGMGYLGEDAVTRMQRICGEVPIPFEGSGTSPALMGAQPVATLPALLQECATADGGILEDGVLFGFRYTSLAARVNQAASFTPTLNQIDGVFAPVNNSLRVRNQVAVSLPTGASATYTQPVGMPFAPTGVGGVGVIPDTATMNLQDATTLLSRAAWLVHLGTTTAPRFPALPLNLAANTGLILSWLFSDPTTRITVAGGFATGPDDDADMMLNGWTVGLSKLVFQVAANTEPAAPYDVAVYGTARYDSSDSTLTLEAGVSETVLSVATTTGTLWSTTASGYDVNVSGERMTVVSVTGVASPQSMTVVRAVNGISKTLRLNATVELWDTPTYSPGGTA